MPLGWTTFGSDFLFIGVALSRLYHSILKRVADIVAASALLVMFAPLMLVVGVAVGLGLGLPILYRDERAGMNGKPMWIAKFRSMRNHRGVGPAVATDGERLTCLGRFLRRTSLDELPQLFSVLTGDMSLVGPRPLPVRYVPRYNARQALRLRVRPGLTGWAQIHGRNNLDWPLRFEYDAEYAELLGRWWAPFLDLWIVMVTAVQVVWQAFTGRGVSAPGVATMQEFSP